MAVTHTVTRTFVAGGTTERPTQARPLHDHEGATLEAGDGTPTNVWASTKRRWEYIWGSPDPAVVERWRTRYKARSTFSHTDPYGQTYTCIMPAGTVGFDFLIQYETLDPTSVALTTYPPLKIQVWEA